MNTPPTIAILGLGLMGGSLARDLAGSGARVLAYDTDPAGPRAALADGILAGILDDSLVGIGAADLVVIAAPVDRTGPILARLAPLLGAGAVVTDVGSTKAETLALAEAAGLGERFVGSHPLAGDHRSGWEAARIGLYHGALVYVCPGKQATPTALRRVQDLWGGLGATCTMLAAAAHDELLAWVSHLPQVASSAVAAALATAGYPPSRLGRGGRDVTRLAGSSPEMWTAICRSNADAIAIAVRGLTDQLARFEQALRARDDSELGGFFRAGREWADDFDRAAP